VVLTPAHDGDKGQESGEGTEGHMFPQQSRAAPKRGADTMGNGSAPTAHPLVGGLQVAQARQVVSAAAARPPSDSCDSRLCSLFVALFLHSLCSPEIRDSQYFRPIELELELELMKVHITQKPVLWVEVGKGRLCGLLSLGDSTSIYCFCALKQQKTEEIHQLLLNTTAIPLSLVRR
jgi:hypothetical protein